MKTTAKLSGNEREFFRLVHEAAFINPYSEKRLELDRRISGGPGEGTLVERVIARVTAHVSRLEEAASDNPRRFDGEEAELVRSVLLFEAFHRFIGDFDRLIRDQVEAGEEPLPVHFAADALHLLRRRGFSAEEARHYFAFFYQLRRAFYFISHSLAGDSPAMTRLRCRLWNNIFTHDIRRYERHLWNRMEDFSTLLLGETGTGKGTAAAAIGRSGYIPYDEKAGRFAESFTRNFIAINLSQFPESLIESELFGHRKGAFTGAVDHHQGVFARCVPHGAIFLDEIGDVSVPVQIKLLKVLQERTFSEVGGHAVHRFRGRVIAATNRSLDELQQSAEFRDDFFYRLCSDVITVPPLRHHLRESKAFFPELVEHVLRRIVGEPPRGLARVVAETLMREPGPEYGWPGNVRELEQAVRRVLLTERYAGHQPTSEGGAAGLQRDIAEGAMSAAELLTAYCRLLHERFGTYEEVARRTGLDRRTVKKYILSP